MYYDEESQAFAFLTGLALGIVIGSGLALLTAPQSGKRTRRRLRRAVRPGNVGVSDRIEDWTDDFRSAVSSGRKRLNL
ncbi:MAG: YtxH domain-containing protein [Longimicrobiales bacterium]